MAENKKDVNLENNKKTNKTNKVATAKSKSLKVDEAVLHDSKKPKKEKAKTLKTTKPAKQKNNDNDNLLESRREPEQLIMEGVERPVLDAGFELDFYEDDYNNKKKKSFNYRRKRKVKEARILTKEEMGFREREPKKSKKLDKIEDANRFNPSIKKGLTKDQVFDRQQQGLTNEVKNKNVKTYKNIFFSNIFTFFNFLCFLVAGALLYVKAYSNLVFMAIILANIGIGIIQEIKAKKTIQKISLVTAPTAQVVRDGVLQEISVNDIVLDDIIHFSLGKQISADSIIAEGEVEVNESLLTGESVPVKKKKGDTLFSGSFVVSGKCVAKVEKVGNFNYSAELASKAKQYTKPKSELLHSLKIIIKLIGIVIIPLSVLMFYNNIDQITLSPDFIGNEVYTEAIKKTAGLVIGMIPAGMFLLTSLALAVGVIKLAKKRTLVQDLYSIEMLARVDILCLDKTGTITDGTMKVNSVIQLDKKLKHTVGDVMGSMLTALDDNNQTSRAMATYFGYSKELVASKIVSFSSARKYSAVKFKSGETYVMGAPEFVYKEKDPEMDEMVKQYATKGLRVILLVKANGELSGEKLPAKVTPAALIVIEDRIREDAAETIKWFKENGVDIKIISGDNPITVSEVSKRVGVDRADKYISLEGLNEQQVIQAATKYTVFGRVSPEQKLILVKALKNKGHKVAMTGDGVNDILALKEADCSIAMASGSEAARHVSNLVLLDSNFSSMPSVVAEGRRVVNNIQKSSSLFLMKTLFTIGLAVFCLIIGITYPFNTNQILLLEYTVIGIPSFFLAMQPNTEKIKGGFLPNLISKSLPGALIFIFNFIAVYVFDLLMPTGGQLITMASISIAFTGLLVLYRISKPIDFFRGVLWTSMVTLTILILTFIPFSFFEYTRLNTQNALFIIVLVQASYHIYNTFVKIIDKLRFGGENKPENIFIEKLK